MPREQRYHCNGCRCSYSVTAKTIFHKTKIDLQKWFFAISNTNLSIRKLAAEISVTKDTASFILFRIRNAIKENSELIQKLKQKL